MATLHVNKQYRRQFDKKVQYSTSSQKIQEDTYYTIPVMLRRAHKYTRKGQPYRALRNYEWIAQRDISVIDKKILKHIKGCYDLLGKPQEFSVFYQKYLKPNNEIKADNTKSLVSHNVSSQPD